MSRELSPHKTTGGDDAMDISDGESGYGAEQPQPGATHTKSSSNSTSLTELDELLPDADVHPEELTAPSGEEAAPSPHSLGQSSHGSTPGDELLGEPARAIQDSNAPEGTADGANQLTHLHGDALAGPTGGARNPTNRRSKRKELKATAVRSSARLETQRQGKL